MNLPKIAVCVAVALAIDLPGAVSPPATRSAGNSGSTPAAIPAQALDARGRSGSNQGKSPQEAVKACQSKEKAIQTRSNHLIQLANGMMAKFDDIASRVEDYYNLKVVPSGRSTVGYSSFTAERKSQKTNIQAVLTVAKKDVESFSCSQPDAKNSVIKFREDMRLVKRDLASYRAAIRNLIVVVRSASNWEQRMASASAEATPGSKERGK